MSQDRARPKTGMLLGKFLPLHRGHVYLIDFARSYVDDLTVVVGTLKREPIPGERRYHWLCETFPRVRVVHLTDDLPQEPSEHPDFWDIWYRTLLRILPGLPDCVFASEDYGYKLAEILSAEYVPVDPGRVAVPLSGTKVRNQQDLLPDPVPPAVRSHYVRRVALFGPESTYKTSLSRALADHYGTVWVPEYARTLLERRPQIAGHAAIEESDMERIVRGQIASEEALARQAQHLLFCDTTPLATPIWSEALFGRCLDSVAALARGRTYALYLLCDVDVPYVAEPVRYLSEDRDQRAAFFSACERTLQKEGVRYVVLRGSFEDRLKAACSHIDAQLRAGF